MPPTQLPLGEQLDPVLLELGSSLYVCQGFEQTVIVLLAIVGMEEADFAPGSLDSARQAVSRDTLGKLIQKLQSRVELPTSLESEFTAALAARNWIAHHFVHDTALDMAHAEGRQRALTKLADLKRTVLQAETMANEILNEYLSQFGPELSDLEGNVDRLWRHLHPATEE